MATAVQRTFRLPDVTGGPLTGAVLTAGVERPLVVLCGDLPAPLGERLARAGLSVVTFDSDGADALARVLAAVRDGTLGLRPRAMGLLGHAAGGAQVIARAAHDAAVQAFVIWGAPREGPASDTEGMRVPWLEVDAGAGDAAALERAVAATVAWFSRHLVP